MSSFAEIFIIFVVVMFVLNFLLRFESNIKESTKVISRHGHRCYIDTKLTLAELNVVHILAERLSHKEYFIFNNLMVPSSVLGTTQIDHVVVSRYGIFVIENKDYKGWIYAHQNQKEWTQTFEGGYKYKLHNPILQNFAHVSALREQLSFIKNRFFSIVVFSENAEFKTPMPSGVIYQNQLVDFILSKKEPIFKEVELLVVIGKLSMLCQVVDVTNEEHAENVQNRIASAKEVVLAH